MAHLPYAFSVHHFISTVGADAGFASIVGLAILVLLFFAQARETTTLRDQLAEAAERVQALEGRLSQALRAGTPAPAPPSQPAIAGAAASASASPAPAPGAAMGAPGPRAAAAGPVNREGATAGGAPPGVGAPAQGAATRLIPDITTVQPPVTVAATAAGAAAAGAGATGAGARTPTPTPAPAPLAPNGSATSPRTEAPPRVQIRPGGAPASTRRPAARSHLASTSPLAPAPRARRALVALLALAAIAAAVVVVFMLTSSGNSNRTVTTTSATGAPAAGPRRHRTPSPSIVPGGVKVAVLNGTATNGLAHRVAVKLIGAGFKQGNVTTAVDQTRTATTVAYLPGERKAALAVASTLKLGSASVAPADQTTRTVACQGLSPAACSAQTVIVTVGSDLANIH